VKGCIFDIKHFAVHDGPGIRTTVFFKGCPLRCLWCHNPEGIFRKTQLGYVEKNCTHCGRCALFCPHDAIAICGKHMTVDAVFSEVKKDIPYYETSGGGVTVSGGECLLHPQFTAALISAPVFIATISE